MSNPIFLFDIDGTLILTGGAGQEAMGHIASNNVVDKPWSSQIAFAGRTDRSIVSDFFRLYNIEETPENFANFCDRFLQALEDYLPKRTGEVLPGVVETLECLYRQQQVNLGLLTGNLRRAAKLKLDHYRLARFFYHEEEALGGFGDRQHERDDVAREALVEIRERISADVDPQDVWIIGDTPRDVQCARAIGANVVAVSTGGYSLEELASTEPDFLVADLTRADQWWDHLAEAYGIQSPDIP